MCSDSKPDPTPFKMGAGFHEGKTGISHQTIPRLLELAAADDLAAFIRETEQTGSGGIDRADLWYCRRSFGPSTKMGFEERTPIMIAALYGSTSVLSHILSTRSVDVNRPSASDAATALHCAAAGGSPSSAEVVRLLISASGDVDAVDASGRKPGDLIFPMGLSKKKKTLEYPAVISLPDINEGVYGSDEFRMYSFKVKPCSRAYSHDWTECPFVHPGENARRRDPRRHNYSCVPCPDFKKSGSSCCPRADACEFAHGVFESWLHPAQYRTRLCKDEIGCSRKVCFFAHRPEDLRPIYASTGSGLPSSPMWQSNLSRLRNIDEMINTNLDQVLGQQVGYGYDSVMNARLSSSASFAKRSQSFNYGYTQWGYSGDDDDVSKFRKSASFGQEDVGPEPDVSWVNTLVRDVPGALVRSSGLYREGAECGLSKAF